MPKGNSNTKAGPVHEIRLGRIRAAIWQNETQNGTRHNVTVSRLYKDGNAWKDSMSFGRDDLPLVAKVLDKCHDWIYAVSSNATGNGSSANGSSNNGAANGDAPF